MLTYARAVPPRSLLHRTHWSAWVSLYFISRYYPFPPLPFFRILFNSVIDFRTVEMLSSKSSLVIIVLLITFMTVMYFLISSPMYWSCLKNVFQALWCEMQCKMKCNIAMIRGEQSTVTFRVRLDFYLARNITKYCSSFSVNVNHFIVVFTLHVVDFTLLWLFFLFTVL